MKQGKSATYYHSYRYQLKRIAPAVLIIFLVFSLCHYFIFQVVSRSITDESYVSAVKIILILGALAIPVGFLSSKAPNKKVRILAWFGYIWMGVFNFLFFLSLTEMILSFFWLHAGSDWVIKATIVISVWSLYKGLSHPKLIFHQLPEKKLKGLKLVQISDLHVGLLHLNENWLRRVVEKINSVKPDIVAITGDLVEGDFYELTPILQVLKSLNAKEKFFITGNHEYINGNGPWETLLADLGFTVLHNENKIITYAGAKILMAGVPDRMISRFIKNKNSRPELALKSDDSADYKILLAHQPASVFDLQNETCDLVLSGHTHGGQIFPFHFFVRLVQPLISGFKTINTVKVFAHSGTGLWGPPMRWFSRSEIVVFEWN